MMVSMTAALPSYHIRPSYGWINDPNGMTYAAGRWHVFFQHNPAAPVHEAIHWGHVSSPDLVTWTEHPVAFGPTPGGPDEFGCWSGVFVPGLDTPAVVYSGVADASEQSTVCLRWGSPDLMAWSDPVVVAHTPHDAGVAIMRDPFVFHREGHRWAIVGARLADGEGAVLLFGCDDILAWDYLGVLVTHSDPVIEAVPAIDIWECPQLAIEDDRVALIFSAWRAGRLEEVVWVTGELASGGAGLTFTPARAGLLDLGDAFYAPQLVNAATGPPLLIGWIREEAGPQFAAPVAGCLSLPRRVHIAADGVRCDVDPRVAAALAGDSAVERLGPGENSLADAAYVEIEAPATLAGGDDGLEVAAGATIWVDAAVAEVFSPGSTPSTWRRRAPWVLRVAPGGSATMRRIPGRLVGRGSDGAALDQRAGE